jgi:hypothetical protein
LGGTGVSTSEVEVLAKRKQADDQLNTEESTPGAEGGGELPLRAEGLRLMPCSPLLGLVASWNENAKKELPGSPWAAQVLEISEAEFVAKRERLANYATC